MLYVNPKYLQRSERGTFRDFTRYHTGRQPDVPEQHATRAVGREPLSRRHRCRVSGWGDPVLRPDRGGRTRHDLRDNKREGSANFGAFVTEELDIGRALDGVAWRAVRRHPLHLPLLHHAASQRPAQLQPGDAQGGCDVPGRRPRTRSTPTSAAASRRRPATRPIRSARSVRTRSSGSIRCSIPSARPRSKWEPSNVVRRATACCASSRTTLPRTRPTCRTKSCRIVAAASTSRPARRVGAASNSAPRRAPRRGSSSRRR